MRKRRKRRWQNLEDSIFQVIHRAEEDRFFAVGVEVERLSHQISRRPFEEA